MSAASVTNPQTQNESKSARKKRAKENMSGAVSSTASTTPSAEHGSTPNGQEAPTNGVDTSYESPYIKELYKYALSLYKKNCLSLQLYFAFVTLWQTLTCLAQIYP